MNKQLELTDPNAIWVYFYLAKIKQKHKQMLDMCLEGIFKESSQIIRDSILQFNKNKDQDFEIKQQS